MRPRRRLKSPRGRARKGSLRAIPRRDAQPRRQGRLSERGLTTRQAVAKRRARSLKRETGRA